MAQWAHAGGRNVSCATCNEAQVVCASGAELFYLEIGARALRLVGQTRLEFEVACIDIGPCNSSPMPASDPTSDPSRPAMSSVCAVGLWTDISARLLKLPDFELIHSEKLGGGINHSTTVYNFRTT